MSDDANRAARPRRPAISLDGFLPYRLSVASNAVSGRIARAYRDRFGLTVPEWRIVTVLAERPCSTPLDLSRATRMDKIRVSRAAKQLVQRGLAASEPNMRDRRSHFLSLTEEGWDLYRRVAPAALELERELLASLTEAERASLDTLLRRIEAIASREPPA
jgi:DNA-binding MarR family transcriptional regulator